MQRVPCAFFAPRSSYNQGSQNYELEQTLQPDEQMWIDVGKLIREHMPDKNGSTLPADLTAGSCEIRDLTNKGVGALFEGKVIYDKTYGHVTYGCGAGCGFKEAKLMLNPLGIPLSFTAPNGVTGIDTTVRKAQGRQVFLRLFPYFLHLSYLLYLLTTAHLLFPEARLPA